MFDAYVKSRSPATIKISDLENKGVSSPEADAIVALQIEFDASMRALLTIIDENNRKIDSQLKSNK